MSHEQLGAPEPTKKKHRRSLKLLIIVGVVLLLAGGTVGGYAWNLTHKFDDQTVKIADPFPSDSVRPTAPPPATGPSQAPAAKTTAQNILLLGSDTRGSIGGSITDISGQRSDTMMIVHIPADRKHVYVMSIMRDSWLQIPGHGEAKVNAALSWGGVPLAVQTVEQLLDTRIDHVAIVDFASFKEVTDALGGVEVNNPIAFDSSSQPGRVFPAGAQHLNGTDALAFTRERYAFTDGDFQRVRNQQLVIKAIMAKVMSKAMLADPFKATSLIDTVTPYLAVDEGLNSGYLTSLAWELRDLRTNDVTFFTMPTAGVGTSDDGQSIVNVDWDKLAELKKALATDSMQNFTPEVQTIR
ncbi:LCP family protein [Homoserinimonas sp. OAct 916]|uniref:LCP family protein n=1 Tax=Homoserinimonas sp. OAct 916 TaxID=2211450 RepID=UPI000DBE39F4|nr:LCP family protein [Homoserinimonas sp. OAct 916]